MTQEERDAVIEECARKAEALDRTGREWVKDSLWANIKRETAASIRRLKSSKHSTIKVNGCVQGGTAGTEPEGSEANIGKKENLGGGASTHPIGDVADFVSPVIPTSSQRG
ncbi:hypothetical protein HJC03_23505 [Rhizobium sp. NLR4b]|uniref:hypothetical protein n=1 Tax=Rhizobium sp. NLR4b TaxID=2731118 RepID=UPI001C835035|nr:hypothetical protein [Rhizobium sp. NLR4b]MBX5253339.1 hypothetical protein [Rhizobium sp. NLR4b]